MNGPQLVTVGAAAAQTRKFWLYLPVLALAGVVGFVFSISVGSVEIDWSDVLRVHGDHADSLSRTVVWQLRAPRSARAFLVGALLAVAGVHMQVLLRNPLADPYILGVSGGAAVGALSAMLAGLAGALVSIGAAGGALASTFLVFGLAHGRGTWSSTRLLLTGVVIAAGWGAVTSLLLAVSPDAQVRGMLFWLMGDIDYGAPPWWSVAVLFAAVVVSLGLARSLNVLAYGEWQARALGVSVGPLRVMLYFTASALTAAAVSLAGSVGFVGLVVPHILRLVAGGDHRWLVPAAVFLGGALLVIADALARVVIAPQQLPVGVITAFLGVPLFLFLLYRGSGAYRT